MGLTLRLDLLALIASFGVLAAILIGAL